MLAKHRSFSDPLRSPCLSSTSTPSHRRRGEGRIFPQLREYRVGDSLRQLVADLREPVLDELPERPIRALSQVQPYAATCHYLLQREQVQEAPRHCGGIVPDAPPRVFPAAMVNQYPDLKRGAKLCAMTRQGRVLDV